MISSFDAKKILLMQAYEDVSGLWEALGRLRSYFPNSSEEERRSAAVGAIKDLVKIGLIEVGYTTPGSQGGLINHASLDSFLNNEDNWFPKALWEKDVYFWMSEDGEKIFEANSSIDVNSLLKG